MAEKQADRLQEIQDMMAELQSLRIGQPVKSVVVVQSDEPQGVPAAQPSTRVIHRRWLGLLAVAGLMVAVVWLTRGQGASVATPTPTSSKSRLVQLQLAAAKLTASDANAALRNVEELCNAECSGEELMTAASAFAVAAALPNVDRVLSEHRSARAVLFLRRAATEGHADVSQWHRLPALANLQARADYRRLVAEMLRR